MNLLKYKYGKTKKSFKAPDSWSEVPYYKFLKYHKEKLSIEQIYELFTGISAEDWRKPHKPELYNAINEQLGFLTSEPTTELPKELERNGNFYPIKKDFLNVPLGKYQDLLTIVREVTEDANNSLEMMPKMVAIFACDDYKDEEELEQITKEIEKMPTDVVYTLGCFFLSGLKGLKNGTQRKWLKEISQKIWIILKLGLMRLYQITVFSILLIISPKETLRSTKKFLNAAWERFTTPFTYKIVSINQKHNTID